MLRGNIYITDDLNFIATIPDNIIVISMTETEDNIALPCRNCIIMGPYLLPPTESYIAEVDGDENLYEMHYANHLTNNMSKQFISAIIGALYKEKSILIYTTKLNCLSIEKFRKLMYIIYGIGVGVVGKEVCQFDPKCLPIWLDMIYIFNIIGPDEYLINYPDNSIDPNIMNKLISDYRQYGNNFNECANSILRHQIRIKEKPTTKNAIYRDMGG